MKAEFINVFNNGVLIQADEHKTIFTIQDVNIQDDFALDEKGMKMLLKFDRPKVAKKDNQIIVSSDTLKAKIKTIENSILDLDYILNVKEGHKAYCKLGTIKKALAFVAKGNNKPILTGVNVSEQYVQATNSFMLFREKNITDVIEDDEVTNFNVTLTQDFVNQIEGDADDILEFEFNEQKVKCINKGITYVGNLLSGNYPNTQKLYEQDYFESLEITKDKLGEILKLVNNEKTDIVAFDKESISIEGDIPVELKLDEKVDLDHSIRVSYDYLKTAINAIGDRTIKLDFSKNIVFVNRDILVLQIIKVEE